MEKDKIARLLELRKKIKRAKPLFRRSDSHKVKRLSEAWRQPRGMHSKTRRKRKGKGKHPSVSYSSPRLVKGIHGSGLSYKTVKTLKDLEGLKEEAVIINSLLGTKKKLNIVKKCIERNIKILNLKNPEEFIKQIETSLEQKKKQKKERAEKKQKSKEEATKKAEEKKIEIKEKKEGKDELAEKIEKAETSKEEKSEKIKTLEKRR